MGKRGDMGAEGAKGKKGFPVSSSNDYKLHVGYCWQVQGKQSFPVGGDCDSCWQEQRQSSVAFVVVAFWLISLVHAGLCC